ncbi:MAG: hypothetical protein IJV39_04115 [Ruminococcus sp.]|nr:hypothetical protein [Ruminococcus sp.]
MGFNFENAYVKENMYKGFFGIEKESLRIDENGYLSHTSHPFLNNPNIDRDFCENQVEIVTNVCNSPDTVYDELSALHKKVVRELSVLETGKELLWQFSNPPFVKGDGDIPIASYYGKLKNKEIYREYLAEKYGKKKMLFSGIHFNFSFDDELIEYVFENSDYNSFGEFKNDLYLELAKKITKYSWLVVYLTAASPVMDGSFLDDLAIGKDVITPFSSARCSKIGYWNNFIPTLKYGSLKEYTDSINSYVCSGKLRSVSELYYPIRLKPKGENSLENLADTGVNHIELRTLDLNPLSEVGIMKEDIKFLHILILYLMSIDDFEFVEEEQVAAVKNVMSAAQFDDENNFVDISGEIISLRVAAEREISKMEEFFLQQNEQYALEVIEYQKKKIQNKNYRYAEIVKEKFGTDYVNKGIESAKKYADFIDEEGDVECAKFLQQTCIKNNR